VKYYAFHDIDIAPEGATLAETEKIFHDVIAAGCLCHTIACSCGGGCNTATCQESPFHRRSRRLPLVTR
jgi:hypothetical protein